MQCGLYPQADIYGTEPTAYESEDESMGRRKSTRSKRGTPVYSKEDIREQYCVNDKEIHVLENVQVQSRLFGCLSNYGVGIIIDRTMWGLL